MKIRKIGNTFLVTLLAIGVSLLCFSPALAHEDRDIVGGKYSMRVGFIKEPAYQGLENGLELTVCTGACQSSKDVPGTYTNGVNGLFDTLKAEVIFGSATMPLNIVPVARNPGRYNAIFVPTRVGDYTFHIFGTIGSDKINEKFTSNPNGFDAVQPVTNVQFPDKPGYQTSLISAAPATTVPATSVAANITPVATTAAPIVPTNSGEITELRRQLRDQQQQNEDTKSSVTTALIFGIIGVVVGVIGLAVAAIALWRNRSSAGRSQEGG